MNDRSFNQKRLCIFRVLQESHVSHLAHYLWFNQPNDEAG